MHLENTARSGNLYSILHLQQLLLAGKIISFKSVKCDSIFILVRTRGRTARTLTADKSRSGKIYLQNLESCRIVRKKPTRNVLYDGGSDRGDTEVHFNSNSEVAESVNPRLPTATKRSAAVGCFPIPNQEEPGNRVTAPPNGSQ